MGTRREEEGECDALPYAIDACALSASDAGETTLSGLQLHFAAYSTGNDTEKVSYGKSAQIQKFKLRTSGIDTEKNSTFDTAQIKKSDSASLESILRRIAWPLQM